MKTNSLLRLLFFVSCFLFSYGSMAQETPTTNCNLPGGGCDTLGVERKVSPWRVGGFIGPSVAFCGSWEATFNSDKYRDKSLFNGIGFNAALNADYFFKTKNPAPRVKLGLGAVAGLQNFFFRKDINTFTDKIVAEAGVSDAVIRKGSSEDHYFAIGPVLNLNFTKKPRSPFLEASVRGGIFRSTPAAIFIYDRATGNNIYSVTASDKRYHAGLLATLGFFVPSKNGLWAWGVEAMGFRTKMDYIFPGATIYPFQRKHGGFSAGLAMRRSFARDVPVKKEPTPGLICLAPNLEWKMGDKSIKGMLFNIGQDSSKAEPIVLTWTSRVTPDTTKTETFTARIHHLDNGQDKVIASLVCQEGNQLGFPAAYLDANGRPVMGQYYATVSSQLESDCANCTSEASTTGFAMVKEKTVIVPDTACLKQCTIEVYAYQLKKGTRTKWVKGGSPDCATCICPVPGGPSSWSVRRVLGKFEMKDCDPSKLEGNLDQLLKENNIKIPSWAGTVFIKNDMIVVGKCDTEEGKFQYDYKAVQKKGKLGPFSKFEDKKKKKK
ncbi:hypothetical protein [Dyadobacter sp. CY312]|uniref:hypothetical protein n=1 Tax=Dyadobacter sp. CY312 TaxID=2907303 RepID=UPI001F34203F|nr:hypothetical protein [Dyadobacter sp. CY312]MCE7039927.1 hypothetical protein [Dyadobacter sp. CY312]